MGPIFSMYLLGNDAEVDLTSILAKGWKAPNLCAGATYTLAGNFSLEGVCTDQPPFTATVSVDGNPIYSPTGLEDNYTVPIPASITVAPGTHTLSIVFSGGTYSNSASCADVLEAPEAAAVAPTFADATTSAEGLDISPIATTNLGGRLMAHRQYIQETVKAAAEAAALETWQQFG
ncbi:hypothetical protein WJX75_003665 [Coccomyxa subellipsoidea]|uniref:Carbohydrate binding module xylan-binding domain-containing protein n=1 Tax=Coccomyxa subellipsoidea TaxID=248742 RepID=A0ABR2YCW2_9CHLO